MEGFLPFSRASFSLDLIAITMLLIIPVMTYSFYLARLKKNYRHHKKIQMTLAIGLIIVIVLFELEIRLFGWDQYARNSPFYHSWLFPLLSVHVCIATATFLLWIITIYKALKFFPVPPKSTTYSFSHKKIARWSAGLMYLTAVTGWLFYWMAFIA